MVTVPMGKTACIGGVVVVIDGEGESWPAIAYYGVAAAVVEGEAKRGCPGAVDAGIVIDADG